MRPGRFSAQVAVMTVVTSLVALPLLAESADELAESIQEAITEIELQVRIAPASAQEELERQKSDLADLRSAAPEHPVLPSLERRIAELEEEIATARENRSETITVDEEFMPIDAPVAVRRQLRHVETLQTRADREMMRGENETATEYLNQARGMIEEIESEYGDRIPPGYAALLVAKERLDALADQLAAK